MKKIISGIISSICIINIIPITANAISENEIIYTETWNTSYTIDNIDTTYPYITCNLNVYNNGKAEIIYWNTYSWNNTDNITHNIILNESFPLKESDAKLIMPYIYDKNTNAKIDYTFSTYPDIGYTVTYDERLKVTDNAVVNADFKVNASDTVSNLYINTAIDNYNTLKTFTSVHGSKFPIISYTGTLSNLKVNKKHTMTFNPTTDIVGIYKFHVFEHDFTITKDVNTSNIIVESTSTADEITKLKNRIAELETQNKILNEQIDILISQSSDVKIMGDINGDNIIDACDASILLTYYAKTSVGYGGTLNEFVNTYKN